MTATPSTYETKLTAFLANEDSPAIANPIHSTDGARQFGFPAAFVGGVTVFGWTVPSIMRACGEGWFEHGWAEVYFRRPVFPGQELTVRLAREAGAFDLRVIADGADRITGRAGAGDAPWLSELHAEPRQPLEANTRTPAPLTLETAPLGELIGPMAQPAPVDECVAYVVEKLRSADPRFAGVKPLIHPAWSAGCLTRLLYHEFVRVGPSIHVSSHLQYLASAPAGQTCTAQGRFVEAYERKGDHYGSVEGSFFAEDGTEILRLRHRFIFK